MVLENSFLLERFNPEVLREYDIRGIVDQDLTANTAYTIGRTFGHVISTKFKDGTVAVGYDGRLTSPKLQKALCKGLIESGVNVLDIGMGPTPMVYFSHYELNTNAAIMVTGSHNPSNYNGFKMVVDHNPFYAHDIQLLQKLVDDPNLSKGKGSYKLLDLKEKYVDRNLQNINLNKKLKIAWDIGNGAMGAVIDMMSSKLTNSENLIINKEVDGTFPNHHPDPTVPENLIQLINHVKKNKCDLGLAFDGDGDRLGVVDGLGNIVWADLYMLLLTKEISKKYKNAKIIMDVKCSKVFFEEAKKYDCEPIMFRTGHSPIKEKMKNIKSPLSGEMSGHIFYADDFYGYDDAMYVGLRLLRILSKEDKCLHSLISLYPKTVSTPEIRFDVEEVRKFIIINEIKERIKNSEEKIIDIDGIRVENQLGWFLIRASNTQNQLTCRAEAKNKEDLKKLTNLIEYQLKLSGVSFKFIDE